MLVGSTSSTSRIRVEKSIKIIDALLSGSESSSDEGSELDLTLGALDGVSLPRISQAPDDYFYLQKVVKILRAGEHWICTGMLASLRNADLLDPINNAVLSEFETLQMIINLCEVKDVSCRSVALEVMKELTKVNKVAISATNLGIVPVCVKNLCDYSLDVKKHCAEIIYNVGHLRRAEKACRRAGGIQWLVCLMDVKEEILSCEESKPKTEVKLTLDVVYWCAKALSQLATFRKNNVLIIKSGVVGPVVKILRSFNNYVSLPVMWLIVKCADLYMFHKAFETDNLVPIIIQNFGRKDEELVVSSALALMKAADISEIVRDLIRFHGGLSAIVTLVRTRTFNRKLTAAVVGALWKSAISMENVKVYETLGSLSLLIKFMVDDEHELRVNALGALAEMAKSSTSRKIIAAKEGVVEKVVAMLGSMKWMMQANAAHLLGQLSYEPQAMGIIEERDGLRMLWSLIYHEQREVRRRALWAVMPTVTRASDPGEIIREISNSLHLLVGMLRSDDVGISTAVCAVVGEVALDYENLGVMTEQGLVRQLSKLVMTAKDENLRRELVHAIANCCSLRANLKHFGRRNIIPKLVGYLATKNQELLAQTCRCFYALSRDDYNCILMHSCGVVQLLLCATESSNPVTQISAAGCLSNIRRRLLSLDVQKEYQACVDNEWWPPRIGHECDPFGPSAFPPKKTKKRGFLQA